ncbi:hypothetical protein CFP59_00259 [Streptomyces malaysiensis subsp. malaysiensis]|nr:hypothetical protein CFP59_00259 [Streptomyces sp. M56]
MAARQRLWPYHCATPSPKTSASSRRPHQRPRAPSTMSSSRAEPVPSRIPVRSMITVTYLSPRRVCVRLDDSAREYGTVGFEPLTGGFEAELVELGERGQAGIGEAVRQVGCAWWPRPASHPPPTEPSPGRARVPGRGGHAERPVRGRVHRCCRCHQGRADQSRGSLRGRFGVQAAIVAASSRARWWALAMDASCLGSRAARAGAWGTIVSSGMTVVTSRPSISSRPSMASRVGTT